MINTILKLSELLMEPGLIQSKKIKPSHPIIAFVISLPFIGLGQIYNGEFLKGMVFFIVRSILLMLIPLYIVLKPDHSYIVIVTALSLSALIISMASPMESFLFALKQRKITLHRVNTWFIYLFYSLITSFITAFLLYTITLTFTVKEVKTDSGIPSVERKEYVLIKTFSKEGYRKGELLYLKNNEIGRIASIGQEIKYANNSLFINSHPLKYTLCSNQEIDPYPQKYHQYLLMEKSSTTTHPIVVDLEKEIEKEVKHRGAKNMIFVVSDNRLNNVTIKAIEAKDILGRIEGVIFSESLHRLFLMPQKFSKIPTNKE